jgi:hypothetical protein
VGGFLSSETEHDRRAAPIPKLSLSTSRFQDKGRIPKKSVLVSSPDEVVSVAR